MNFQTTTGAAFILTVKNRYYLCGGKKKVGVVQPHLQITCKTETVCASMLVRFSLPNFTTLLLS